MQKKTNKKQGWDHNNIKRWQAKLLGFPLERKKEMTVKTSNHLHSVCPFIFESYWEYTIASSTKLLPNLLIIGVWSLPILFWSRTFNLLTNASSADAKVMSIDDDIVLFVKTMLVVHYLKRPTCVGLQILSQQYHFDTSSCSPQLKPIFFNANYIRFSFKIICSAWTPVHSPWDP